MGVGFSDSLDATRKTLPSTAAAGLPKAIEEIAPAVYEPIPERVVSVATSAGKLPP